MAAIMDNYTVESISTVDPMCIVTPAGDGDRVHYCTEVLLRAVSTNTGVVRVGDNTIDFTTKRGLSLAKNESIKFTVTDPRGLFCLASAANQELEVVIQ